MSTPVETDMLSSGMSCRKTYVASPSDNPDKSAKVFFESALTLLQDSIWVCLNMGYTSETKRTNSNGGNYDAVTIAFLMGPIFCHMDTYMEHFEKFGCFSSTLTAAQLHWSCWLVSGHPKITEHPVQDLDYWLPGWRRHRHIQQCLWTGMASARARSSTHSPDRPALFWRKQSSS